MFAVASCAALFAFAAAPSGATDADASALIAKHKAFLGWTFGDGTLRTLKLHGTIVERGAKPDAKPGSFDELRVGTLRRKTTTTPDGLVYDWGFTGKLFWQSNVNGFTTPEVGDLAKDSISYSMLFDEATTTLAGTLHGTTTIDGTVYPVVRFVTSGALTIDVAVDAATGAYRRAVIDPGGTYDTTYDILSYVDALPGKKLIGSWRVNGWTYAVEKVVANADIGNDELHPPAQTARWTFDDTPVPIELTPNRIIVSAAVNGVPGRFLLDTGAGAIYLSGEFARKAHVVKETTRGMRAFAGEGTVDVSRAETVSFGKSVLHDVLLRAGTPSFDREAPDGVIGFDFFGGAIADLDLDAKTLVLHDPAATAPDRSKGVTAVVDLSDGRPQIPMQLNGSIPVRALLDSGNAGVVFFGADLIAHSGLRFLVDNSNEGILASHRIFIGANGDEEEVECGKLESLSVGPIRYAPLTGCKARDMTGNDIVVGLEFIRGFNIVFDYPDGVLLLTPRK